MSSQNVVRNYISVQVTFGTGWGIFCTKHIIGSTKRRHNRVGSLHAKYYNFSIPCKKNIEPFR